MSLQKVILTVNDNITCTYYEVPESLTLFSVGGQYLYYEGKQGKILLSILFYLFTCLFD